MTLSSSPLARTLSVAAGALLLTLAAGSQAHAADRAAQLRHDRPGAERALTRAQALAHGRGVRGGRELSPALASLSARRGALSPADRKAANELLARPTDPGQTNQPGGPYTVPDVQAYSTHYCYHWVKSTADAPSLADDNQDGIPNYIIDVANVFETVWAAEHDDLGWRAPKTDDVRGGCDWNGERGLTDVYIKDIGKLGLYGYASPDSDQPDDDNTRYGFLVMDDDYSAQEFPGYSDHLEPLEVTAAHEYNHVLQYAYDILQDKWMFESTATWMEEKVFPAIDDYHQYLEPWSQLSQMPITVADSRKMYGSAIFNRWIDDEYGENIVRRAWERSTALNDFAPAAYDAAIREANGPGFSYELINLAASTAEWQHPDSRVHDGGTFPEMKRVPLKLPHDGSTIQGKLDHTGFALFDVAASDAPALKLSGGLPPGVAGGIALIGRNDDGVWKDLSGVQPQGGHTSVTLKNPGQYDRITAVVVNADWAVTGWGGSDWNWSHDQQPIELSVSEVAGGGEDPGDDPGGNPGGGGNSGGGGSSGPIGGRGGITPAITPAIVQLSKGAAPRLKKAKALTISANANRAGSFSARATVSRKTAKALRLGRKAMTIGTGKATLAAAGASKVKIKLTAKARAKLKRAKKTVTVIVQVTFTPVSGAPATGAVKIRLKP